MVSFWFFLYLSRAEEETKRKREIRTCSNCKQFIPLRDPHQLCIKCRSCTPEDPCEIDASWTPEQWRMVQEKLEQARQKEKEKTPALEAPPTDMTAVLRSIQAISSAFNNMEKSFATRLQRLETPQVSPALYLRNVSPIWLCLTAFSPQHPTLLSAVLKMSLFCVFLFSASPDGAAGGGTRTGGRRALPNSREERPSIKQKPFHRTQEGQDPS